MKGIAPLLLALLLGVSSVEAGLWCESGADFPVCRADRLKSLPHALLRTRNEARPGSQAADARAADAPGVLKIAIEVDGLYRLTQAQLRDVGLDLMGVNPRTIKITHRESEIPITVHGEEDGVFDDSDSVEFYGTAMTGTFTVRNVYWLTAGGAAGLRMAERDGTPAGVHPTPSSFYTTLHAEEDHVYWQNIPNGEGQDHWFWRGPLKAPIGTTLTFDLRHLATEEGKDATVRVGLKGRTDDYGVDPDHHTLVALNGVEINDALWDGQIEYQHEVTVRQTEFGTSVLAEGINTLTVESVGDTGARVDSIYVNWFEVDYWDTYTAEEDVLTFLGQGQGTYQFIVSGFSQPDVSVFDITDPAAVVRVVNLSIRPGEDEYNGIRFAKAAFDTFAPNAQAKSAWPPNSVWHVSFQDTVQNSVLPNGERRYLALTADRREVPADVTLDEPSDLRSPENRADYVIITHRNFYEAVLPLAHHREQDGFEVKVVQVTDVYDEFSGGIFDPAAIRDFLRYAYDHWALPPAYVLLVGDANMDYKDNFETGVPNYVPTHLFETWPLGETPSDNWFVRLDGDVLPDMATGRIPARSARDVEAVVEKILSYEESPGSVRDRPERFSAPGSVRDRPEHFTAWNRKALFVADDDQSSFESISEQLIGLLPPGYLPTRLYARGQGAEEDLTADIIARVSDGALIVHYIGHGFTDRWGTWAGGRIFQRSDIGRLEDSGGFPLLVTSTCLNGFFPHPLEDRSLAEDFLLTPGKGGIAAWSPTGLGYPSDHRLLIGELFKAIFRDGQRRLGPATTAAKIAAHSQSPYLSELVETFVLFGDPALKLNLPALPGSTTNYLPLIVKEAP